MKNISKVSIVYEDVLGIRMITEAKDQNGNWKPTTYFMLPNSFVGNYKNESIGVNEHKFFFVRKCDGNFKTTLRIKILIDNVVFYSNEFVDSIDERVLLLDKNFKEPQNISGMASDKQLKDALLYNEPYALDFITYKGLYKKNKRLLDRYENSEKKD